MIVVTGTVLAGRAIDHPRILLKMTARQMFYTSLDPVRDNNDQ
jgi:hypothetical protein